jgi:signal transduction histidine kinase
VLTDIPTRSVQQPRRGHFDTARRSTIVLVAVAGIVGSVAGSWWLWSIEQRGASVALEARTEIVVDSTERALSDARLRLASVAGLFQASVEVTEIEFRRFVRKLELTPGMDAIGYMPMVMGRNRDRYESEMRSSSPEFILFDVAPSGFRVPSPDRRAHFPIQWLEPETAFAGIQGYDSMSDPGRGAAMEHARLTRDIATSPFMQLISQDDDDGFVVYWPITDAETEALVGYAVAAMDLGEMMDGSLAGSVNETLEWAVHDITGTLDPPSPRAGVAASEIGGRTWQIVITPRAPSDLIPNAQSSLLLLATGLLATAFVAGALDSRRRHRLAREEFDRLRDLNQSKDQFLASVGHELRTPLTSVLGFAELLRADGGDLSDEERKTMISSVAEEASDLASIVDDLLVAARSELDLVVVTEVPVSARAQVAQVLEVRGREACRNVQVIGEQSNPYRALGDPSRVRQILRNMVTNACRYGGEEVEVRLGSIDGYVTVGVADNGTGVAPEDQEQIFTPYYRAHSSESQPAALGIGLSVARQLARLMHGDLIYRRQDGWTVFELRLPIVSALHPIDLGADLPSLTHS